MRLVQSLLLLAPLLFLSACAPPFGEVRLPAQGSPRQLMVFMDGTNNDPSSQTNVYRMKVELENQHPAAGSFYIEGVGAGRKVLGGGSGWGIGYRTVHAYRYLAANYHAGDRVQLFGFSRGAYSARMLAAMLYYAGLPDLREQSKLCQPLEGGGHIAEEACLLELSMQIYAAYKGDMSPQARRQAVNRVLADLGAPPATPVTVDFLGIWDTVEALGLVDTMEAAMRRLDAELALADPEAHERNRRYGDQLCNVRRVRHAMSLDDNRAHVFTPRLLTLEHALNNCLTSEDRERFGSELRQLKEVWFNGDHSDVGGGWDDCTLPHCRSELTYQWAQRTVRTRLPGQRAETIGHPRSRTRQQSLCAKAAPGGEMGSRCTAAERQALGPLLGDRTSRTRARPFAPSVHVGRQTRPTLLPACRHRFPGAPALSWQ